MNYTDQVPPSDPQSSQSLTGSLRVGDTTIGLLTHEDFYRAVSAWGIFLHQQVTDTDSMAPSANADDLAAFHRVVGRLAPLLPASQGTALVLIAEAVRSAETGSLFPFDIAPN